jgi:AraC-like DNA-binding protein/ligand-binding sensor protein
MFWFDTLQDFSLLTGVGVTAIDLKGLVLFRTEVAEECERNLTRFDTLLGVDLSEQEKISMIAGAWQSSRFGGRFIYYTPRGFIKFCSPIIKGGEHFMTLIGGPLLMTDYDDYIDFDLLLDFNEDGVRRDDLIDLLRPVPVFDAEKTNALSEQLYVNALHISDPESLAQGTAEYRERYAEYILAYADRIISDEEKYRLTEERQLIDALARNDEAPARALLNDIIGHILFHTGKNIELLRSRVIDLLILISRAAERGSEDDLDSVGIGNRYINEMSGIDTIEELIVWLNSTLTHLSGRIFDAPSGTKHGELIKEAVSYMNEHYTEKLTLDEVAGHVFISPPYLSKVFAEEMGHNFKHHLNTIRIAKAKDLLMDPRQSLTDIALSLGYGDQSYFTKVFKKHIGVSPRKYREMALKQGKVR